MRLESKHNLIRRTVFEPMILAIQYWPFNLGYSILEPCYEENL